MSIEKEKILRNWKLFRLHFDSYENFNNKYLIANWKMFCGQEDISAHTRIKRLPFNNLLKTPCVDNK